MPTRLLDEIISTGGNTKTPAPVKSGTPPAQSTRLLDNVLEGYKPAIAPQTTPVPPAPTATTPPPVVTKPPVSSGFVQSIKNTAGKVVDLAHSLNPFAPDKMFEARQAYLAKQEANAKATEDAFHLKLSQQPNKFGLVSNAPPDVSVPFEAPSTADRSPQVGEVDTSARNPLGKGTIGGDLRVKTNELLSKAIENLPNPVPLIPPDSVVGKWFSTGEKQLVGTAINGLTGGILKPETTALPGIAGKIVGGVGLVAGSIASLNKIGQAFSGIAEGSTLLTNLIERYPSVAKYAFPIVKNAVAFGTYGQLDPDLQNRFRKLGYDAALSVPFGAMGLIPSAKIAIPASFALGYGLAKLDGASNEDAFVQGGILATLDAWGRTGGQGAHFVEGRQSDQLIKNRAFEVINEFSDTKLTSKSTPEEIKAAYREAAHTQHPDLPGGSDINMKRLNAAYEFLSKGTKPTDLFTPSEQKPSEKPKELGTITVDNKEVKILDEFKGADNQTYIKTKEYGTLPQNELVAKGTPEGLAKDLSTAVQQYKTTAIGEAGNVAVRDLVELAKKPEVQKIVQEQLQKAIDEGKLKKNEDGTVTLYRFGEPKSKRLVSVTYDKSYDEKFPGVGAVQEFKVQPKDIQVFIGKDESEVLVKPSALPTNDKQEIIETPGTTVPAIYYHGTTAENAKLIKEGQLKPTTDTAASFGKAIYLSSDKTIAGNYPEEYTGKKEVVEVSPKKPLNIYRLTNEEADSIVNAFGPEQQSIIDEILKREKADAFVVNRHGAGDQIVVYDPNLLEVSNKEADEIKRISNNLLKNNPDISKTDAETMARDLIQNKTNKTGTQKEQVAKAIKETPKTIKQIAEETKILEPNVRRILGVGAKNGVFERVDKGVYILSVNGEELAYIHTGDAVETLPKLAADGFKADMVFLDIPYKTAAVTGGNRGVKYDLISTNDFKTIVDSVDKIVQDDDSPVFYMFSQAQSGLKDMQRYTDIILEKFKPVARGEYTKLQQDGVTRVRNMRGNVIEPEGIILFNRSGEFKGNVVDGSNTTDGKPNLNFKLVRPKGYQTEKPAEMIKALIEMSTDKGDVVLDPFAGSGVVPAEAVKAGRKAVAIEKKADVVEKVIKPRVKEALASIPQNELTLTPRVPAYKRVLQSGYIVTKDSWGNMFVQMKGKVPEIIAEKGIKSDENHPESNLTLDQIVRDTSQTLTPVEKGSFYGGNSTIRLQNEKGENIYVNGDYLNIALYEHPKAQIMGNGREEPIALKEGDEVVASVMPLRLKDSDFIPDTATVKEKIATRKRAPSGMAATGGQPIGTFEQREGGELLSVPEQTNLPAVSKPFKLYEKTVELIRKYAKRVGEDYTPRGAVGVLYPQTGNIRLNSLNNLSTAAHEVTHYIDRQTDLVKDIIANTAHASKLRVTLTDLYEEYYPTARRSHKLSKRMEEGVATLVQKYTEQPSIIEAKYPLLVEELLKPTGQFFRPQIAELLQDLQQVIADYQGLAALDKIGARITSGQTPIDKKKFLTPLDNFRTIVFDNIYPIEKLAAMSGQGQTINDPSLWMRLFNNTYSLVAHNINGGRGYWTFKNGDMTKVYDYNWKTLTKNLKDAGNLDAFNQYLVARREYFGYQQLEEMTNEIADTNPVTEKETYEGLVDSRDKLEKILKNDGFTRMEVTSAYQENKARFVEEEKMFDTLVRADLDLLHDPQVMLVDHDQYSELVKNEGYATFKREMFDDIVGGEDQFAPSTPGKTKASSMISRTGSQKTIIDPLAASMRNHAEIMRKALKQVVDNKIVALAPQHPDLFQQVPLEPTPNTAGFITYPQEKDPNIIMGRIDYKRVPVVTDALIKNVVDDVLTFQNYNAFEKGLASMNRIFQKGTTGLYIPFAVSNVMIDQVTAVAQTRNNYIPVYSALKEITKAMEKRNEGFGQFWKGIENLSPVQITNKTQEGQYLIEYLMLGGDRQTFGHWQDKSPSELYDLITHERKGLLKVLDWIDTGADIVTLPAQGSEIMTRATEYIKARKAGKAQLVALEEAGRITAPFHHIGSWKVGSSKGSAKMYIKAISFFNPSLQVIDQLYRSATDTPEARKRLTFVSIAVTAAMIAAFAYLFAEGSDKQKQEYLDLEPEELAKYLWYPNPFSDNLIRIRVPDALAMPGTVINMITADLLLHAGYTAKDIFNAGTAFLPDQVNLNNPVRAFYSWLPQAIKPTLEVSFNKRTFPAVRDLETQSQQARLPENRAYSTTSAFAIGLGKALKISPIKIDYLIQGYLGRASKFATGGTIQNPLTREYYFTAGRRIQDYYDLSQKTDQKLHDINKGLIDRKTLASGELRVLNKNKALSNQISNLIDQMDVAETHKDTVRQKILRNQILDKIDRLEQF